MGIIAVRVRDRAASRSRHLRSAVVVVVVGEREGVAQAMSVASAFSHQLVGVVVAECRHIPVCVGSGQDVAGIIVGVAAVGKYGCAAVLVPDVRCSVGIVIRERADATVVIPNQSLPSSRLIAFMTISGRTTAQSIRSIMASIIPCFFLALSIVRLHYEAMNRNY